MNHPALRAPRRPVYRSFHGRGIFVRLIRREKSNSPPVEGCPKGGVVHRANTKHFYTMHSSKSNSILLILALVPAPSLGVLFNMIWFPDTTLGTGVFVATKIWMFSLPFVWWWFNRKKVGKGGVDIPVCAKNNCAQTRMSTPPSGLLPSTYIGIAIVVVIVGAYILLGERFIDKTFFVDMMHKVGLGNKWVFFGAMMYWICVNSLLEEVVWRWFVTERFAAFTRPAAAVVLSGLCFTLHHILAMSVFFPALTNAIASAGVFAGGVLFSWLYVRYKSIWPPYIAHVFADIAIFGIGYHILVSNP